jgi:hypothetical protein
MTTAEILASAPAGEAIEILRILSSNAALD